MKDLLILLIIKKLIIFNLKPYAVHMIIKILNDLLVRRMTYRTHLNEGIIYNLLASKVNSLTIISCLILF